jgi:hypothetical protein
MSWRPMCRWQTPRVMAVDGGIDTASIHAFASV